MCGEDGNGDNFEKMSMFKIIVYVHFIVSVSILTLIMLNIIIAIMTDTYELVMTKVVQSDYQEINKMIMQYENLLYRKRESGRQEYLYWASYNTNTGFDQWVSQS